MDGGIDKSLKMVLAETRACAQQKWIATQPTKAVISANPVFQSICWVEWRIAK